MYNNFAKLMLFLSQYCYYFVTMGFKEWGYGHHIFAIFLFIVAFASALVAVNANKVVEEKIKEVGTQSINTSSSVDRNHAMRYIFSGMGLLFIAALFLNLWWSWTLFSVVFVVTALIQLSAEKRLVPFNPFLYFKGYRLFNVSVNTGNKFDKVLMLSKIAHIKENVSVQTVVRTVNVEKDSAFNEGYMIEE